MTQPQLLNPTRLAARWGVSSTMVYDMLNSGQLPGFRLGGKLWRIRLADVEAYESRPVAETARQVATDLVLEQRDIADHRTRLRIARLTGEA